MCSQGERGGISVPRVICELRKTSLNVRDALEKRILGTRRARYSVLKAIILTRESPCHSH